MNDADIILVNPPTGPCVAPTNLGLAVIEPYLRRAGVRCFTVDGGEIERHAERAPVFGLSVLDHTYAVAREITRRLAGKTVIWGGWTPSVLPEYCLEENPGIDYLVLGEGERRLLDLLRALGDPGRIAALDGIAFREGGRIVVRPPVGFLALDDLPMPNELATLQDAAFVELSRGCYGRCRFCQETSRMRFKSARRAAEEIGAWRRRGFRLFFLGNANALANRKQLRELLDALEAAALDVRLAFLGRPDDVLRRADVLERYFASPVVRVHSVEVGFEANTQAMLDALGRRSTPELNREAMLRLIDLRDRLSPDTRLHANIILFPHFDMSLEDLLANMRFVGEFGASRDTLSVQLYGLAGTPVWREMRARGFPVIPEMALRIHEVVFTDPVVDRLFGRLVRDAIRDPVGRCGCESPAAFTFIALMHHVHDTVVALFRTGRLRESVLALLEAGPA